MVISCSAYGCTNKWSKETSIPFSKPETMSEMDIGAETSGMTKMRLKRDAVPSVFNFPVEEHLPEEFRKLLAVISSPKKRSAKRGRKKRKIIKPVPKVNHNNDEFNEALIEEMEVFDSDEFEFVTNENSSEDESIEDALADADEEDKCYLLGSMWGERLKLLPLDVRLTVRQLIDNIFKEAVKKTLREQIVISNDS